MLETEIKLAINDSQKLDSILKLLSGRNALETVFEDDTLFDFGDRRLFRKHSMFRLRISTPAKLKKNLSIGHGKVMMECRLTWKGPVNKSSGFKERDELEFIVNDLGSTMRMIDSFKLKPIFHYQKYRAVYDLNAVKVAVDDTPMGFFLEIEGNREMIDNTAGELGFSKTDYITKDYYTLWKEYRRKSGISQTDMLFTSDEKKKRRR